MQTNQVMVSQDRELCGIVVRQRTADAFMSLDDIQNIAVKVRLDSGKAVASFNFSSWLALDSTQEFLRELEKEIGSKPYIKGCKGRTGWVHPFFAIKILTHYNPAFEVQVYKWLFDYLIKNRITSADSYIRMCGTLYKYTDRQFVFAREIIKPLAARIKCLIGCEDWNQATEQQLKEREYIYNLVSDLTQTLQDSSQGIELALKAYKDGKEAREVAQC